MGAGPDLTGDQPDRFRFDLGPADFDDWDGLHGLLSDCFASMDGRIDPPSSLKRMTPDDLRRKAMQDSLIAVFHGDELVACGFLTETDSSIYLGKLAVREGFRRRGILRAIVAMADDLAVRRSTRWLELQTRIELTENHRTFEALGFTRVLETAHPGFDRVTSITMRKTVSDVGPEGVVSDDTGR